MRRRLHTHISAAVLLSVLLLLAGCGQAHLTEDRLDGTSWVAASLYGNPPLEGTTLALRFSNGYVAGFTGCNQFLGADEGGKYKITRNGGLTIGNFMQSVMLCSTPEGVMDQENAYRAALTRAATYRLVEDRLEIQDATGDTILVFTR